MPFKNIEDIFSLHFQKWPENINEPTWEDLEYIPKNQPFFDDILDRLNREHIALVLGPPKCGKTFMTYLIAFHWMKDKQERKTPIVEYAFAVDVEFAKERKGIKERQGSPRYKYLYILEDCHKASTEAKKFLKWALVHKGACYFLFTIREGSEDEIGELFPLLSQKDCVITLIPNTSHIKKIIWSYIDRIKSKYPKSPNLNPSEKELEEFIQVRVGTNLDLLMRFLSIAWNPERQSIKDVGEDEILRYVWKKFGLDDPRRRDILSILSALGQFDMGAYAPFLENTALYDEVRSLEKNGDIFLRTTGPFFRYYEIGDLMDSEYILKAIASSQGVDYELYCAKLMRKYVIAKPPNIIRLVYALWQSRKKALLNEIFRDSLAMTALQEQLATRSFTTKLHVGTILEIVSGDLAHSLLSHEGLKEQLGEEAKGAPAYRIRQILAALGGVKSKREFFALWSKPDYIKTIKSTRKLNTLRLLFYDFQMSNLHDTASKFAEHLPEADWEGLLDPAEGALLLDLNKLIGNLKFIPKELSLLFEKLSTLDLGALIGQARVSDVRWLLWQLLQFGYNLAPIFVKRHKEVLSRLKYLEPAEAFWIVWNVFQADKESACYLVKSEPIASLLKQTTLAEALTMALAKMTLLHLCEVELPDILLPQMELDKIASAINNESDVALLALSLKALMVKIDEEKLLSIKPKVDLEAINFKLSSFPIPETQILLQNILDEFRGCAGSKNA
jgi:hypothetical protein